MNRSTPGLPVHHQLLEFTRIHSHRVSDAIQPSHPLSSPSPPAANPAPSIKVFSNESTLHMRWPKYWSFSFSIIPSNEHPELISFRMDWLDLLAVQGTLKSLLQHQVMQVKTTMKHHLIVTWMARRSNQSILKEIGPGCSLEEMMLKLKFQYFGHFMQS